MGGGGGGPWARQRGGPTPGQGAEARHGYGGYAARGVRHTGYVHDEFFVETDEGGFELQSGGGEVEAGVRGAPREGSGVAGAPEVAAVHGPRTYSEVVADPVLPVAAAAGAGAVKSEPVAVAAGAGAVTPEPVAAVPGVLSGVDSRSEREIDSIQLELHKFKLNLLVNLTQLPLKGRDDVADMVDLSTKLRQALEKMRKVCLDKHPTSFVRGWKEVLNRCLMKHVKLTDPRAAHTSQVITNVFAIVGTLLDDGVTSGPEAIDVLVRELCAGLISVTPADVF